MMEVGNRIKEARRKAGLTQGQVADKLGVSTAAVAQWERGIRNPKYQTLSKIAAALDVNCHDLLSEGEPNIAEAVFKARKEAGLSQQELGEIIGVKKSAVSKWENGSRRIPANKIAEINRACGSDILSVATREECNEMKMSAKDIVLERMTHLNDVCNATEDATELIEKTKVVVELAFAYARLAEIESVVE